MAQLVRLTGLFGISENGARVALSRMVAAGEATSDGSGRYRLAGHLAARQSRQSASRAGATVPYDGRWWLAVVTTTGSTAEVRSARRGPWPTRAWPSSVKGCGCARPTWPWRSGSPSGGMSS